MEFLLTALGLVILVIAGEALVRGAVSLSLRLGIPPLVVGLTIVAFGTSAPELLVSVQAVREHAPGIAIGNVIGSNIANVLLVLGLPALLFGMNTSTCETRRSYVQMIGVTLLLMVLAGFGSLTWKTGLLLLALYLAVMWGELRVARSQRRDKPATLDGADDHMPWPRILGLLAVGLVGLPLGADILVDSASTIARAFGISETVIGLTLVAVGTSLPEMATTMVAAARRQADVAVGNVIGSNIANVLAILGGASMFGAIPIEPEVLRFDIWVMLGAALLLMPFAFLRRDISHLWGLVLTALYVAYVVTLLI